MELLTVGAKKIVFIREKRVWKVAISPIVLMKNRRNWLIPQKRTRAVTVAVAASFGKLN